VRNPRIKAVAIPARVTISGTQTKEDHAMGLFKPDLYRNFAIGFALGAGLVVWQIAPSMNADLIPQAQAAPVSAPADARAK
jgi:hypothetical protein